MSFVNTAARRKVGSGPVRLPPVATPPKDPKAAQQPQPPKAVVPPPAPNTAPPGRPPGPRPRAIGGAGAGSAFMLGGSGPVRLPPVPPTTTAPPPPVAGADPLTMNGGTLPPVGPVAAPPPTTPKPSKPKAGANAWGGGQAPVFSEPEPYRLTPEEKIAARNGDVGLQAKDTEWRQWVGRKQAFIEDGIGRGYSLEQLGTENKKEHGQADYRAIMDKINTDPETIQFASAHPDWVKAYKGNAYGAMLKRKSLDDLVRRKHLAIDSKSGFYYNPGGGDKNDPNTWEWLDNLGRPTAGPPQGFQASAATAPAPAPGTLPPPGPVGPPLPAPGPDRLGPPVPKPAPAPGQIGGPMPPTEDPSGGRGIIGPGGPPTPAPPPPPEGATTTAALPPVAPPATAPPTQQPPVAAAPTAALPPPPPGAVAPPPPGATAQATTAPTPTTPPPPAPGMAPLTPAQDQTQAPAPGVPPVTTTPNGDVTHAPDGQSVLTLNDAGKVNYQKAFKIQLSKFGKYPGSEDPNHPLPKLIPGKPAYNPLTGTWS